MDSKTIIKLLKQDGWYLVETRGSHCQFKHPVKKGRTTVPHPKKDFGIKMLESISKVVLN